jgi:hypothetical protein
MPLSCGMTLLNAFQRIRLPGFHHGQLPISGPPERFVFVFVFCCLLNVPDFVRLQDYSAHWHD